MNNQQIILKLKINYKRKCEKAIQDKRKKNQYFWYQLFSLLEDLKLTLETNKDIKEFQTQSPRRQDLQIWQATDKSKQAVIWKQYQSSTKIVSETNLSEWWSHKMVHDPRLKIPFILNHLMNMKYSRFNESITPNN